MDLNLDIDLHLDRRAFLRELSQLGALLALGGGGVGGTSCTKRQQESPTPRTTTVVLTDDERATLRVLCARVLPTDEFAGATEAGCAEFIESQLADRHFGRLRRVLSMGLRKLEDEAKQRFGRCLQRCEIAAQDEVIRAIHDLRATTGTAGNFSGEDFMRVVVVLVLEGYLSDPRHGGNRDGRGWQLAGFSPVRYTPLHGRAFRMDPLP